MQRSTHRILTTHCGSLPRPNDLLEMLMAREQGRLHDMPAFHTRVRAAIGECVRKQRDTGLDIVNDGEWSKPDYSTYDKNRFTGFEGEPTPTDTSRDMLDFPLSTPPTGVPPANLVRPTCNGPIAWKDFDAVRRDIDNLKAAAGNAEEGLHDGGIARAGGALPGQQLLQVRRGVPGRLADVLKDEYKAIRDAGFRYSSIARTWARLEWAVPLTDARGVSQGRRPAPRSAQHGDQRHPARAYAPASLLGQLRGPAPPRHSPA